MPLPKASKEMNYWKSLQFHFLFQILIEVRPDSTPALVCAIGGERGGKERGRGGIWEGPALCLSGVVSIIGGGSA